MYCKFLGLYVRTHKGTTRKQNKRDFCKLLKANIIQTGKIVAKKEAVFDVYFYKYVANNS